MVSRKRFLTITVCSVISVGAFAFTSVEAGDTYVRGYVRRDGTYVAPHHRSTPDGNPYNNYGFPGNVNPYDGERATGKPDAYLRTTVAGSVA